MGLAGPRLVQCLKYLPNPAPEPALAGGPGPDDVPRRGHRRRVRLESGPVVRTGPEAQADPGPGRAAVRRGGRVAGARDPPGAPGAGLAANGNGRGKRRLELRVGDAEPEHGVGFQLAARF